MGMRCTGSSKKMDRIWNRCNLKSIRWIGRPVDFCFSTVPVSLNWFIHRFKALSTGGFSPGCKLSPLTLHCDNPFQFCIPQHKLSLLVNRPHPAAHWLKLKDNDATVPKSPPPHHVHMTHHRREHRPSISRSPTCGSRVNDERLRCLN